MDHNEIIKFVATCVIQPYCWVKSSQATLEFLAFHLRFCINFQKEFYIGLDYVCFFLYSTEKLRPDHNPDVPIWGIFGCLLYLSISLYLPTSIWHPFSPPCHTLFCISPPPCTILSGLHFAPNCFIEFTIPWLGNVSWDKLRIYNFDINSMGPTNIV